MTSVKNQDLEKIISEALDVFYERRLEILSKLDLDKAIKRKNPYLFRAIGCQDASEIVDQILSAFMSSSDEGVFGDFFETVVKSVSGGQISPSEGVDVSIETERSYKAIAVKSGPSVFNAQSKGKQNQDFQSLQARLRRLQKHFEAIVGYGYGRKISEPNNKKIFRELAGQAFWEELTGDAEFYKKIIIAMKNKPLEHKEKYNQERDKAKNIFTREFLNKYCYDNGEIDWEKILEVNSGKKQIKKKSKK